MIIHNETLKKLIKDNYTIEEVINLKNLLVSKGTFHFNPLKNGLFPAVLTNKKNNYTGYSNVWVRDNTHIAYALYNDNQIDLAINCIKSIAIFYIKYNHKFSQIINKQIDFSNPMNRPHVRFDGEKLEEINEKWAHAQNDAIGYFLWIYSEFILHGLLIPSKDELNVLHLIVNYFESILYWQDEDSGHWEETRKVSSSSIGTVIAGLSSFKKIASIFSGIVDENKIDYLINKGYNSLNNMFPNECSKGDNSKFREYDAAMLFLLYPLKIEINECVVLKNIIDNLQGEYGIKRYLRDSYWAPNYKQLLPPEQRTIDFSDRIDQRNGLISGGTEAQWCIFDPIISVIYGNQYKDNKDPVLLEKQILYFNRSISQLTHENSKHGGFKCPELYYLEDGNYIQNDNVPLLWTQANLLTAINKLIETLKE